MKIFFGKINKNVNTGQLSGGYYISPMDSPKYGSGKEKINIGDYCFIIGGSKIALWKAKKWQEDRLVFDIIIKDVIKNTSWLMAFKFFKIDISLLVLTKRQSPKAFYLINHLDGFTEKQLLRTELYKDKDNFRTIKLLNSKNEIIQDSIDIQLYYENGTLKVFNSDFINEDVLLYFKDNSKFLGKGRKQKDNSIKKLLKSQVPKIYNADELSIGSFYDAYCVPYGEKLKKDETKDKNILSEDNTVSDDGNHDNNLNIILFGPPGTGKTYHTINKAIEIINHEFDLKQERKKIKEEYDRLVEKGQIVFTTFHQSMSYEDFIEGIKPKMNASKKGDIEYEIKDGIFKEISKKSFLNIIRKDKDDLIFSFERLWNGFLTSIKEFEGKDKYIFKTITESELKLVEIRESGNLAVMYRYNGQYQEVPATSTLTASKDKIRVLYENDIIPGQVETLVNDIKPLVKSHASLLFAVYEKFWKFAENKLEQTDGLSEKEIDFNYIFNEIKSLKENKTLKSKIKNCEKFVLIIDEVNRGNVSQIFGELITLIEEDKRIGKKEELKIILPYSKNKFGVPPNLYIIGTMNTADRSIEALDTALRRRFTFKEMPPNTDVIENEAVSSKVENVDLVKLLETINLRIEKLIDKDHMIGHSYFLNIKEFKDLRIVFKDKIIPLLEEYFYGDYGKINLILGNAFVQKKNNEKKFSFAKNSDAFESDIIDDLKNRTVYYITNDKEWKAIDFQDIYK